ncbi:MAG: hypothetical protein GTO45_07950 [Candidatus Aminicenantes bacterium]|nr:hypothetical protein [Candidatus Aminicenantes bacterium]NIM78763.1 hypothetical protein [Candidatus Aminicenantes bacterium]NIN18018.1 hypothetical protein [Candidatus Aminicenantes bacterium]NIN41918.1 hypothetical protein [Candidatus Aminicenantes bacterium]NIN84673.1 hypothetical protein [Candidatus Aminicenantes bacterium]
MERGRIIVTVIIFILFVWVFQSCRSNQEKKESFFLDDNFHFVLYTDPSTDCLSCILTGLRALETIRDENGGIVVFALETGNTESFHSHLKMKFDSINVHTIQSQLDIPHPSILLIKKKSIYMYFHLSLDPFVLKESIDKVRDLFTYFSLVKER